MRQTGAVKLTNWYVIYTYPNQEKKIYNELCKRGLNAFLPVTKVLRRWSDRNKLIEIPLFLNYMFVNIYLNEIWKVLMLNGVSKFVSFNGSQSIIKEEEIECIRKMMVAPGELRNEKSDIKGQRVKVMYGPLAGLEGKILDRKGLTRFYVALESINQIISVDIYTANLAKIAG